MGMKPLPSMRARTRLVIALLVAVGAAAVIDLARLWRDERLNLQIQAGPPAAPAATTADAAEAARQPAELRFAQAHALAASEALDQALNRYRALQGDSPLGQAARYNSANLLMRQAIAHRAAGDPGRAIALLELAKENYRELLRHDPQHWDARYNLERAQRLLPDPEEADDEAGPVPRERERAPTTMRAYSPGLP